MVYLINITHLDHLESMQYISTRKIHCMDMVLLPLKVKIQHLDCQLHVIWYFLIFPRVDVNW